MTQSLRLATRPAVGRPIRVPGGAAPPRCGFEGTDEWNPPPPSEAEGSVPKTDEGPARAQTGISRVAPPITVTSH
eukprot:4160387-Prymnesium_polylepis.1